MAAGKKTLSQYGPASPPRKLLLEKQRRQRRAEATMLASGSPLMDEPYSPEPYSPEPYSSTPGKYAALQRAAWRGDGSPTRVPTGSACPTRMAQLPHLDTPPRRMRLSRESLTSTLTVVPSVAVAVEAIAEAPATEELEVEVEEEDASERVGEELYTFLGEAKLTQFVPVLRDLLGAQTVADLLEIDEADMDSIGLRKLERKRLGRCLEEYAETHSPQMLALVALRKRGGTPEGWEEAQAQAGDRRVAGLVGRWITTGRALTLEVAMARWMSSHRARHVSLGGSMRLQRLKTLVEEAT